LIERERPVLGLLPRLVIGLVVAMIIAFTIGFFVDRELTRGALRAQGERQVANQLELLTRSVLSTADAFHAELTAVKDKADNELPDEVADPSNLMRGYLNEIATRRYTMAIRSAYARDGTALLSPGAPQPVTPPRGLFDDVSEQFTPRVVPTIDGGWAYAAARQIGRAPNDYLVVVGEPFDSSFAQRLRDSTAGIDVVLMVDGELVGTSLATLSPEAFDDGWDGADVPPGIHERDIGDRTYWLSYTGFATAGPRWGEQAAVGVLVREPLSVLDDQLVRSRTITAALLLLLVTGLASLVSRRLTRPLSGLTRTAERIAEGDLEARFEAPRNDEVGLLSRTLEQMRRGLGGQLDVIRHQASALRSAARRIVGAQDEARHRIAGELHDGVQQQLVMLRMHLGAAKAKINADPGRTTEVFAELGDEIDAILARLRETAQGIYPAILRDRGLQGALFSLAGRADIPIDVTTRPDPLPRLDREIESNAYFLAAEAVTNALKHGAATRVTIEVSCAATTLHVVVTDDGKGFDPSSIRSQGGLFNLHDRAAASGGAVRVRSRPGGGTTVDATVPLDSFGPLEEEQHSGDPAVDIDLVAEPELSEDRVGVLLDRPLRDDQLAGDGGVPLPRGHE
jgi:signal transduction histidine kinase